MQDSRTVTLPLTRLTMQQNTTQRSKECYQHVHMGIMILVERLRGRSAYLILGLL